MHAGNASLPVRETACLLCDASPRLMKMSRFVPWALVALCFALGVASRSISDSFVVFVPALQSAFDASRSAITVVYSFALLVGGTGAPLAGWIVDRFGLRALTVIGMSVAALATASQHLTGPRRRRQEPPEDRRREKSPGEARTHSRSERSDHGVLEGSHAPDTGFFHEHPQTYFLV